MRTHHKHSKLEDRIIDFSVSVASFASRSQSGNNFKPVYNQMLRSGVSAALNYSEAIHAESRKDFVHKMKVVLKELRETYTAIRILIKTQSNKSLDELTMLKKENNELISIFVTSVKTAEKKLLKK